MATLPLGYSGYHHAGRLSDALLNTFTDIRIVLIVGIGGGVPFPEPCEDPLEDIHLGDVVVGWARDGKAACIHYGWNRDKGNTDPEILGTMEKGDWILGQGLAKLASDHESGGTNFQDHLKRLRNDSRFAHPGLEHGRLFRAAYKHHGEYGSGCEACSRNPFALVQRPPRSRKHIEGLIFHQGKIASGNSVIQDGERRDKVSEVCGGVLCVEMEAVGIDVSTKYLVIRGISDYANSHKNDRWKLYAAGNAAVFSKELLCKIKPIIVQRTTLRTQFPDPDARTVSQKGSIFSGSNRTTSGDIKMFGNISAGDGNISF
ncbi:hypothetical protein G6514_004448 [Epicoccum nigrum]|nr:hypothetical protein G6514_004448 [Epicoccum nigrum]